MGGHEIDGLRGDRFRRQVEITLVFPVLIIHQNDHLADLDILKNFFNGTNHRLLLLP